MGKEENKISIELVTPHVRRIGPKHVELQRAPWLGSPRDNKRAVPPHPPVNSELEHGAVLVDGRHQNYKDCAFRTKLFDLVALVSFEFRKSLLVSSHGPGVHSRDEKFEQQTYQHQVPVLVESSIVVRCCVPASGLDPLSNS